MRRLTLLSGGVLAVIPAIAFASGKGLGAIISPEPGSMLWTLIVFAILLVVLRKYAWGPIIRGLESREEGIRSAIDQANKDRENAAKQLREYEEKLKSASVEINERISRADHDAQTRIEQARDEARLEGEKLITKARAEIEAERGSIAAELRKDLADLATEIAAAAIRESFNREDQLRIIRSKMDELESNS